MGARTSRASQGLPLTLVMARDGYQVDSNQYRGRQSAGASFLEAYLNFSGNNSHHLVVPHEDEGEWFHQAATAVHANARTEAVGFNHWGDAASRTGAIHVPDPCINDWAWKRMPWGDGSFSLIGIVHTLCSRNVQHALGQYTSAPVRPWDALICTSQAARSVVEGFLERQEIWLRRHNEACRFERPQLPVIPLGIHTKAWNPPVSKVAACRQARAELGLRQDAEIVLIAGRLDLLTKFQPAPLFRALGELQQHQHPHLELIIYGEAPNPAMLKRWQEGAQQLAPSLTIHWIAGRKLELAAPVRWAADVFISLSDNPQETFGITPLEAMAAELPCLVSDWDGYRESVVQPGEPGDATGLRVTTRIMEGLGTEESAQMLQGTLEYDQAVGRIGQGIAVDLEEFKQQLSTLLNNPNLRASMGAAGRQRVEEHYNWRRVIERWRDLLAELSDRRRQAVEAGLDTPPQLPPWMPNTSTGFGCFASEIVPTSWTPEPPAKEDEEHALANPLQSWDRELLMTTNARRRGWWLKQGLVSP